MKRAFQALLLTVVIGGILFNIGLVIRGIILLIEKSPMVAIGMLIFGALVGIYILIYKSIGDL